MSARATKAKKKAAKRKTVKKKAIKKKTVKKKASSKPAKKKTAPPKKARPKAKKTPMKAVKKKAVKKAPPAVDPQALKAARAAYRKLLKQSGERLEAKRRSLIQAYNNTKGNTRDLSADGTEDYIDYAVSSYDRDFMLSLTEMERKQLMLVEEALQRVRRKTYGKCLQCAEQIPGPRLQVEPWARHCIRCQELEEQGLLDELIEFPGDDDEADEGPAAEAAETDLETGDKGDDEDEDDDEATL